MASQANLQIGKRVLLLLLAVAVALLAASGAALAVSKACPKGTTQAKTCSGTRAADKLTGTSGTDYINELAANDVPGSRIRRRFIATRTSAGLRSSSRWRRRPQPTRRRRFWSGSS